jgi:predicted alpha-1,2-mannosidase
MIATGGVGYAVNCGYPGANVPLGMVKMSPDTATMGNSADGYYRGGGYHYDDQKIQGFSHMHLYATGITGHGVLATMPSDGFDESKTNRDGYGMIFSHEQEWAEVGRYEVHLDSVEVELTATKHTALHEYRFDTDMGNPTILIDVAHAMGRGVVSGGEIRIYDDLQHVEGTLIMDGELGDAFPMFFYGSFSTPATSTGTWKGVELLSGKEQVQDQEGQELGAWFSFPQESTVQLRMALSNVDLDGAKANYSAEHSGYDLSVDIAAARTEWEDYLSAVEVWGGTEDERSIFATALYHSLQMPSLYSDADFRYRGFDGEIHNDGRPFYNDFSLWDTYRTTHPLYTLLWPQLHQDVLWSLAQMSLQGNGLPRWPLANSDTGVMLGTSLNIVFAEALQKGVTGFDEDALTTHALDAMMNRKELSFGAPPNLYTYDEVGYWPADEVGRSVAWTQEQAVADFALGTWAKQWGAVEDGEWLLTRSGFWKELWDEDVGFFHGRNRDGSFIELTSESQWIEDYAEGNARQYLWMAPHDPEGLFSVIGANHLDRLREFFVEMEEDDGLAPGIPEVWYWHGNEIDIHAPFLFALAGAPHETDQWVQWIMNHRYSSTPDGLAGNDDGGTLSAWYVWASMGLYPLAGTDRFVLTLPIWDRILVRSSVLDVQRYTQQREEVWVDGQEWMAPDVRHGAMSEIIFR